MRLELKPNYDTRKSFYGKSFIEFNEYNNMNKVYTLYSYNTPIMYITKFYIYFENDEKLYTNTTMRHIRELLRQYGDAPKDCDWLKSKKYIWNITKKQIFNKPRIKKGYICFNNTLRQYNDTRQTAIREMNK